MRVIEPYPAHKEVTVVVDKIDSFVGMRDVNGEFFGLGMLINQGRMNNGLCGEKLREEWGGVSELLANLSPSAFQSNRISGIQGSSEITELYH